jgi:CRISPR-associated endonuclease Csn1
MKKILGLDIGTNSIGWALTYEDDDNNSDILDMGVRIVSSDSTYATEFEKGQAISKNENRRTKRGMRRSSDRYKQRRLQLITALQQLEMLPDETLVKKILPLELYGLRDKAAKSEKLTLQEIGRILLHLNQKRGYKSNRKANNDDEKESNNENTETKDPAKMGYLDKINDRESQIRKQGLTIGQYFYQTLKNTEGGYARLKQQIFTRQSYIFEFDKIWDNQKVFYPNVLTDKNKTWIKDEILYYQRPLKSQKHLVSNCRFEKGHKTAPRSLPIFQHFKILQIVNNLILTNVKLANTEGYNHFGERFLTIDERQKVFDYLDTVKNVKSSIVLKKVLTLNPNIGFALNYDLLEGNATKAKFLEVFEKQVYKNDKLLNFDVHDKSDKQPYLMLWHKVYSVEDPVHLIKDLMETFQMPENVAKALAKISLPDDYGSLSTRAIRRLLPHLEKGFTYDKACEAAAKATGNVTYNEHKTTKEESMSRTLGSKVEQVLPTELRNPVVEQIVNQVINLVNKIITNPDYVSEEERQNGEFEIRIELARELKSSQKQRKNTTKNIADSRKNNDRIRAELEKIDVRRTLKNIEKYKLWEEQGKCSPYILNKIGEPPVEPIPLSKLFDENQYDVDHILPRSRFFDDSMTNKVIAETWANREKANKTGYEYMESKGKLVEYTHWVNKMFWQREKRGKRERLLAKEIPTDFVTRQLKETQYITKEVVIRLKEVSHNVWVSSGAITEYLRETWGLNDTLKTLNWEKYKAAGKTKETKTDKGILKSIDDWSKRDDHRHHAIDALIVAFTRQGMIQSLNSLNAQIEGKQTELKEKGRKFPQPMPHFVARAIEMTDKILISHRKRIKVVTPKNNHINKGKKNETIQKTFVPRGALHQESIHGRIKQYEMVALSSRFKDWQLISHPTIKALVLERLEQHNGDPSVAFKNYAKNPIFLDKAKTKPLLKVTVFCEEFVIKYAIGSFKLKDLAYVLDAKVRNLIEERLKQYGDDPKKAFKDPLYYDEAKKIPILSVRCKTGKGNLLALHQNEKGEPINFVSTGSNHHLAIYENDEGKKDSDIVSFWLAAQRKLDGEEIVLKQHPEKGKLLQTFSINDMFIVGLNPYEVDFFDAKNAALISKHLYRIQKITKNNQGSIGIYFRHHLETKLDDSLIANQLNKYYNIQSTGALDVLSAIKVQINNLGKIEKILTI